MIKISDLIEYDFCPRILFWYYCCPVKYSLTYKMQYGIEAHSEQAHLEMRRTFAKYGVDNGEKLFDYQVETKELIGKLDLLIKTENTLYPVEYKYTRGTGYQGHYIQLYGYAYALHEIFKMPVNSGFIYYPRFKEMEKIDIGPKEFELVKNIIQDINTIIDNNVFPKIKIYSDKCKSCRFLLFCNDVN